MSNAVFYSAAAVFAFLVASIDRFFRERRKKKRNQELYDHIRRRLEK